MWCFYIIILIIINPTIEPKDIIMKSFYQSSKKDEMDKLYNKFKSIENDTYFFYSDYIEKKREQFKYLLTPIFQNHKKILYIKVTNLIIINFLYNRIFYKSNDGINLLEDFKQYLEYHSSINSEEFKKYLDYYSSINSEEINTILDNFTFNGNLTMENILDTIKIGANSNINDLILKDQSELEAKKKYLKYKNKYLKLKKIINSF
jgi:hypothetical protein